jgi:aryl-alcohol dehydrogenase-like predicted oxidoreductase
MRSRAAFPGDPNGGGAGRSAIVAQLNETLRRMQTDYLDLYWLHTGIVRRRSRKP